MSHPQVISTRQSDDLRIRETIRVPPGTALACSLEFEIEARTAGYRAIAGVDEVGRGALFGPVYAAAVILADDNDTTGIDDSKRLSPARRETLAARIRNTSRAWAVGAVEAEEIDRLGIVAATHLAMQRAVAGLAVAPDLLLIDGYPAPAAGLPQWPILKGDARSVSIAAASIVAKVARDALIRQLDEKYPGYGLARNMGYGSHEHCQALVGSGPTALHRRTFCKMQLALPATDITTEA